MNVWSLRGFGSVIVVEHLLCIQKVPVLHCNIQLAGDVEKPPLEMPENFLQSVLV